MASSTSVVTSNGSAAPPPGAATPAHVVVPIIPTCLREMRNLVNMQIKGVDTDDEKTAKLVAQEALKEWKEAVSVLEGKVERRNKQTDRLIYEIYQLVGLYSVFLGVVFTAVLQSNRIKCQHLWSPVVLCFFAWVVIIHVTHKRFKEIHALRQTIKDDDRDRQEAFGQIRKLKAYGHMKFDFALDIKENRKVEHQKVNPAQSKTSTPEISVTMVEFYLTTVINNSDSDYKLKQGNAGIYTYLTTIAQGGGKYVIQSDPNATYREYWVGSDADGVETIISSDDCVEYEKITIQQGSGPGGRRPLDRLPRSASRGISSISPPPQKKTSASGWLKKFWP